ncbi:hypothetical protein PULV_a3891 [Pseudoalteromonas ulvae UL12]|uniref:hypothetical protein n=1 Tax=Pseudoalteromonas ulvae TaxID=107327 RepID=UPI00186B7AA3|nr:hypothetical protein [Pseudoalteromonas ulvae]MBE0362096.1 hypothetical protein [Pseudoalteromonas ulvae UL12]
MEKEPPNLDELLSQCDEGKPMPDELKEWDRMRPVGKEFGAAKGVLKDIPVDNSVCEKDSLSDGIDS